MNSLPTIQRALVIIPTYCEAECVTTVINAALAADPRLSVLIVDDGSPDGTATLVKNHPEFSNRLNLLERAGKLGLGSAYRDGFKWGLEREYDTLLEMDADLSHDPADIPRLLTALESGADVAIGSRYLGGTRVRNWPLHRLALSKFASLYVRLITGMPLTDATSGFKAIRRPSFERLEWTLLKAEGYAFQVELHHQFWKLGLTLREVPIIFTERCVGKSKMSLAIAREAALRTWKLRFGG